MATESTQIDSVTSSVEASIVDVDDGSGEGQFALSQPSVPVRPATGAVLIFSITDVL